MAKYLFVEGDYGDADYTAKLEKVSEKQMLKFLPLIQAIKKNNGDWDRSNDGGNTPEQEYRKFGDVVEEFSLFIPYPPEQATVHTLDNIRLLETTHVKNLL